MAPPASLVYTGNSNDALFSSDDDDDDSSVEVVVLDDSTASINATATPVTNSPTNPDTLPTRADTAENQDTSDEVEVVVLEESNASPTTADLKKGRGNGSICRCLKVRLKRGIILHWKNWEGKKVNCASVDDIDWIEFEHWPDPPRNVPRKFRMKAETFSSIVQFPLSLDCDDLKLSLGNVRIKQFPVNSTVATTGHKLQGMSKDTLIVNSWNYGFANWVYVVLSRVRTLEGLFLCKPLDLNRKFNVPEKLIHFERRMKTKENDFLLRRAREMSQL